MKPAQVDALVVGYQTGKTMKELAAEFGRSGLGHDQIAQALSLYQAGWSSGRLADEFGVSADTVLKVLRRAGVAIRPRRGGPRNG